jgi:hypothetical protein
MGIRLEIVLMLLFALIVWGSFTVKLNQDSKAMTVSTKELEFTKTTFTEVDTKRMQGRAYATYGVRNAAILTLDDVVYYADNITSLTAKKGRFEGDMLKLDWDVVMEDESGYLYKTDHARYNQKTQILNLTTAFSSQKDKNIFHGSSLVYNVATKEAFAKTVDAILYTVEK